jgi:monovalent cation/hydrogen antiporter
VLALNFATAIVVHKHVPSVSTGFLTFVWLTGGGVGLGLLAGWIVEKIERRINDGPIEITLSILVPYAVYLASEKFHASGVLAVVVCGLLLSRRSARFFSPSVRIQIWSVWQALNYVLNGLVFVLIGLQLPAIRASIRAYGVSTLLIDGLVFSALVIVLRLVWVFPEAGLAWFLRTRNARLHETPLRVRNIFVVGWTGMRGVVSLAAALALPVVLADGSPFPQRNLIIFLTFCVILVTLVLQGITLPHLVRALGLAGGAGPNCEEQEARRIVIEAAVSHLREAKEKDIDESTAVYDDLTGHYQHRLARVQRVEGSERNIADHDRHIELSLEALRVERETAIRLRDEGRINDEVLRRIERELDLSESRNCKDGRDIVPASAEIWHLAP